MKNFLFLLQLALSISFFKSAFSEDNWHHSIQDKKLLRFTPHAIIGLMKKAQKELGKKFNDFAHKFIVTNDQNIIIPGFKTISDIENLSENTIKNSLFLIFFHTDDDYFYTLKQINDNSGKFYSLPFYGPKTRYIWTDKHAMRAVDKTFAFGNKISHQNLEVHETICECLEATKNLPGDYVEIGVYMGGSALTALHYMNFAEIERNSYFLDTFDGMSYEEAHNSPDLIWDNTHKLWGISETMSYVNNLLKTTNQPYQLVESNICRDSLPKKIKQIAVCNLDVDLYDATRAALEKIAPLIVKGGIIICEDPTSTPTLCGALLAMEEFLITDMGSKFMKLLVGAQYLLIKTND